MYLNKIFLVETMISYIWLWIIWLWIDSDTQPMGFIHWYSDTQTKTNEGYSLVFRYPNQCGLFIGTLIPSQWGLFIDILIPKPIGIIHWYFDTQPMGVIHWYFDTQPMGVIHWYSNTQTKGGYSLVLWYPNQWGLFIGTLMPSHGDIAWP